MECLDSKTGLLLLDRLTNLTETLNVESRESGSSAGRHSGAMTVWALGDLAALSPLRPLIAAFGQGHTNAKARLPHHQPGQSDPLHSNKSFLSITVVIISLRE